MINFVLKFLLVDDDDRSRDRLAIALKSRSYKVMVADGAEQALERAQSFKPNRAVIDLRMPGTDGLQLLSQMSERFPRCQMIMLTGYGSIPTALSAMRKGAVNFLQKPADAEMILAAFSSNQNENICSNYAPPTLARVEWEHIQRVLDDCGGNISQAAQKLGLHRRTLQRKLKTFPPRF